MVHSNGFGVPGAGKDVRKEMPMNHSTSHLRPDGTTFPPVTPDPPPPPGWVDPLEPLESVEQQLEGGLDVVEAHDDRASPPGGEHRTGPEA